MRTGLLVFVVLAACENRVTLPDALARAPGRERAPAADDLAAMRDAFVAEQAPAAPRASTSELVSIAAGQSAAVVDDERGERDARNGLERARRRLRENAVLLTYGGSLTSDASDPTRSGGAARAPLQSFGGGY
ncbi:MAG TPA: hypothetical protein VLC93_17365 [Myxococcota bacterium]|nr:hypothetical protein [Myxococcota bacterium]